MNRSRFFLAPTCSLALALSAGIHAAANGDQPGIETRIKSTLSIYSYIFKDLNANGALDRYEDGRLPAGARAADLVAHLTVEEKAGLMLHAAINGFTGPNGIVLHQSVSMTVRGVEAVHEQRPDVPFDLANLLFRTGFGLTYPAS